jgi:hypothetical protein
MFCFLWILSSRANLHVHMIHRKCVDKRNTSNVLRGELVVFLLRVKCMRLSDSKFP